METICRQNDLLGFLCAQSCLQSVRLSNFMTSQNTGPTSKRAKGSAFKHFIPCRIVRDKVLTSAFASRSIGGRPSLNLNLNVCFVVTTISVFVVVLSEFLVISICDGVQKPIVYVYVKNIFKLLIEV